MPWYLYNPGGTDVSDPNQYALVGSTPPTNCPSPKDFLCAIQANDNGGHPILNINIAFEIANALNNRAESTNVKLRPTR